MKKEVFSLLLSLSLLACSTDGEEVSGFVPDVANSFKGEVKWIKRYGGEGDDTAQSVITTSDGGYAVLGFTNSIQGDITDKSTPVNDYWLLKLDAEGEIQWSKTYGGSGDDRGQAVIQTADGGYAIAGYARSEDGDATNNEGFHDHWILKLDTGGTIQWEKSFGFSGHDHSYDILQTADRGLFFVGFLDAQSSEGLGDSGKGNSLTRHGVGEFWGTKLDADGNLQWQHYFGGTNNDRAYAAVQGQDGGILMTGFSESTDSDISITKGSYDFWTVKLDARGNLVWDRSYGGSEIEVSYDIETTQNGGYIIAGHTFSSDKDVSENHGNSDFWLVEIDGNGNIIWEKTFGGSAFDSARAVKPTADGGFAVCGNSRSSDQDLDHNAGENDIWVFKTDGNGVLLWQQSYGGSGLDFAFDLVEPAQGGLLLVGQSDSPYFHDQQSKGKADMVLVRIH